MADDPTTARMLERAALRQHARDADTDERVARLSALTDALLATLVAQGTLAADEAARLKALPGEAPKTPHHRLRVHQLPPRQAQANADVDCAERFALCHGACCCMEVPLQVEDLEAGEVRWDLSKPYLLRREADNRCTHQDRATLFCGAYGARPSPCRAYSCAGDQRIWRDFERRVPNVKGIQALLAHRAERPVTLPPAAVDDGDGPP